MAIHAKRITIQQKDIQMALRVGASIGGYYEFCLGVFHFEKAMKDVARKARKVASPTL
jgi:hypothetical protein